MADYNQDRNLKSLANVTPVVVYFGRELEVAIRREKDERRILQENHLQNLQAVAAEYYWRGCLSGKGTFYFCSGDMPPLQNQLSGGSLGSLFRLFLPAGEIRQQENDRNQQLAGDQAHQFRFKDQIPPFSQGIPEDKGDGVGNFKQVVGDVGRRCERQRGEGERQQQGPEHC